MGNLDADVPIQGIFSWYIQMMTQRSFDLEQVLANSGLNSKTWAHPATLVNRQQELCVYANMRRLLGTENAGLTLGALMHANGAGMLGGLVANAVNVEHAGYLMRRFNMFCNYWFAPELIGTLTPGKVIVRYRQSTELGNLYRMMIDLSVSSTQQVLVGIFGSAARAFISEIAFGYPAPQDQQLYATAFDCPVTFGHDVTYVTFELAVGKLINPARSEYSYNLFQQHCQAVALRYAASSWQQTVLNLLACIENYPAAEEMAEKLNCSERSLRRHLGNEGVQYSELIDKIRFDRAVYLLRHSHDSVKKIGYQLSYSEPGAFIRAFSRWAGMTPNQFRRTM
jgi:AraC-like DNA-binding protein